MQYTNIDTGKNRSGIRIDLPLLILNLGLIAATASAVALAFYRSESGVRTAALRENVFLTTEWKLLKQLKERTDLMLREKDREIDELRSRYRSLRQQNASEALLSALETELNRAETERQAILAARFGGATEAAGLASAVPTLPGAQASAVPPSPARADSAIAELLGRRIAELERENDALREDAETLGAKLERARAAALQSPTSEPPPAIRAPDPAVAVQAAPDRVEAVLSALEASRERLQGAAATDLADLRTRALLRAIVRVPTIRAEYPDLQEALDRYLDRYGAEQALKGKREAYDEAIGTVRKAGGE